MRNDKPDCPFCLVLQGIENDKVLTKQKDIIWKTDTITAFVCPQWWPNNPGHVLVISNEHIETLYEISDTRLHAIYDGVKQVALALKDVYKCDGVSTRQHNEKGGGQEVMHFHVHVYPRYEGDQLYQSEEQKRIVSPEERLPFVAKLKPYFDALKK
jgi:histidine triad (HIT) family protein